MKKLAKWCGKKLDIYRGLDFPIDRIIGKSFMPPSLLPHQQLLEQYEAHGRQGFNWRETPYFHRVTTGLGRRQGSFDALPDGLDIDASWWLMPWAWYPGKERNYDIETLEEKALRKISDFFDLYESIKNDGYDMRVGGAIRGYILEHPVFGQIFNQIDGHHRLAILDFLSRKGQLESDTVRVFPIKKVSRAEVLTQPECLKGLGKGVFSEQDVLRLFDHPFQQLGFEAKQSS